MAAKHRLQILREDNGLSRKELAELSGLSPTTIYRIENDPSHKTNYSVAEQLAGALYVQVSDIFLDQELSHLGRPALTGDTSSRRTTYVRFEAFVIESSDGTSCGPETVCSTCHLVVPRRTDCWDCGAPLN